MPRIVIAHEETVLRQGAVRMAFRTYAAGSLLLAALFFGGCSAAQDKEEAASVEEETIEETTTEETTTEEPCSKGPPQSVNPLTAEDKARAEAEMASRPEEDWSMCYAVWNDGSITSVAEVIGKLQKLQHEQETKAAQKATGTNEGGQDISNIPKTQMTPERSKCFRDYLTSASNPGAEQQRVVAEANTRGITPPEVVGC